MDDVDIHRRGCMIVVPIVRPATIVAAKFRRDGHRGLLGRVVPGKPCRCDRILSGFNLLIGKGQITINVLHFGSWEHYKQ